MRRSSMGLALGTSAEALVRLPTTNATKYDDMGGVGWKLRLTRPPARSGAAPAGASLAGSTWGVLKSAVRCAGAVRLKLYRACAIANVNLRTGAVLLYLCSGLRIKLKISSTI